MVLMRGTVWCSEIWRPASKMLRFVTAWLPLLQPQQEAPVFHSCAERSIQIQHRKQTLGASPQRQDFVTDGYKVVPPWKQGWLEHSARDRDEDDCGPPASSSTSVISGSSENWRNLWVVLAAGGRARNEWPCGHYFITLPPSSEREFMIQAGAEDRVRMSGIYLVTGTHGQ